MIWEQVLRLAYRQPGLVRWPLALLMFGLALGVRLALSTTLHGNPFITFFPAIIGATLLCGWRAAAMVLVLSVVSSAWLFPPPFWLGQGGMARGAVASFLFSAVAVFQIVIVAALLHAVRVNHRMAAQEKTLFLELQHRVANTLQFIASLLTLARQGITTPQDADAVLEQAVARIGAMGKLHRRMYNAANEDRGLAILLQDILAELFHELPVTIHLDVAIAGLPLSQMTPVVLLVTEAATNSAKHVFRTGAGSAFNVTLRETTPDRMRLTIQDDGPGVPEGTTNASGLGLRIMHGLAAQLGGKLTFENRPGATVVLEFKRG